MAHAQTADQASTFDELDPHGYEHGGGAHKSHVIVGPFTLRIVLAALLIFTILTVGQARAEVWVQEYFSIELPKWLNVAIVMGIACIKAALVMAFFMQLKYDNPINSVIMAFTFLALGLFLGFTALDLFNRDNVYKWKAGEVISGGTGAQVKGTGDQPLYIAARERFMQHLSSPEYIETWRVALVLDNYADQFRTRSDAAAAAEIEKIAARLREGRAVADPKSRAVRMLEDRARKVGGALGQSLSERAKALVTAPLTSDTPDPAAEYARVRERVIHAHHHSHEPVGSTASRSRGKAGSTDALLTTDPVPSSSQSAPGHHAPPKAPGSQGSGGH